MSCYGKEVRVKNKAYNCEHTDKRHAAFGLCKTCYTRKKRNTHDKKAWMCEHVDRPNYKYGYCRSCDDDKLKCKHKEGKYKAKGLCTACYEKYRYHLQKPEFKRVTDLVKKYHEQTDNDNPAQKRRIGTTSHTSCPENHLNR